MKKGMDNKKKPLPGGKKPFINLPALGHKYSDCKQKPPVKGMSVDCADIRIAQIVIKPVFRDKPAVF